MSPQKLLVLSYEYPPIGGGGGVMLKNLLENFSSDDFSITLITTWFNKLPEMEIQNGIRIFRVKSKRRFEWQSNPLEMLSWVKYSKRKAEELLENENFHLVISNFVIPGGLLAHTLFKKYKLPYICISHGHDIPWVKPYDLYPFFLITQYRIKKIIKNSAGTFVLSKVLEKNAKKFVGNQYHHLIHLMPNGVNEKLFFPRKKDVNKIVMLLFVGRLVSQKGVNVLMKIALQLKNEIPFFLTIVGDGPKRKQMELFCRKNELESCCNFLGKIPQNELANVYSQSDILIAPSVSEGMSLSIIEAVCSNLFVISSDVSGNMEIINSPSKGVIIEKNDYKIFVKNILGYIINNKNSKINVNELDFVEPSNIENWKKIANKYTNFIKNLNIDS